MNRKKVLRIMREKGWLCHPRKKKWTATTDSNHGYHISPSLVKGLDITAVNQVWVADITYIHILTALSIWRLFWTHFHGKLSAMPYLGISIPTLRWMHYGWPSKTGILNLAVFITQIVAFSMPLPSM